MALGPSMKESDMLLSRAEKLRRDARRVRSEATRLSDAGAVGRLHRKDVSPRCAPGAHRAAAFPPG